MEIVPYRMDSNAIAAMIAARGLDYAWRFARERGMYLIQNGANWVFHKLKSAPQGAKYPPSRNLGFPKRKALPAPSTPPKTPSRANPVTGKRKNPSVTDNMPKKASKVNPGTLQMAKTGKRKNSGSNRRGGSSKRSNRKSGSKKGKKGKSSRMKTRLEKAGPIGRLTAYLPTKGAENELTNFDFKCYDLALNDVKNSGFVNCSKNEVNWIGYQILTKIMHDEISKTGERPTEKEFEASNSKGLFDPAPTGVKVTGTVTSGAETGATVEATGTAANYIKTRETFVYDKVRLTLQLSNCNTTPTRVWVDLWKCKDDLEAFEATPGNRPTFGGPIYEIANNYRTQPYFQGDGAHTATTTYNLFKNTEFLPLKVPGRQFWSHQNRQVLYLMPGDEVEVVNKLTNVVFDGKDIRDREDTNNFAIHFVKNCSYYITVAVMGLLGKSTDTDNPSAHVKAEVSTQLKMDIVAHRSNVFMRQPKQYIVAGRMQKIPVTSEPTVIELNRTAYPAA